MRKYILLLLLAIGVLPGFSQKFYRYVDNEKDILTISGDKFFVSLKDSTYAENLSRVNFISKLDRIDNKGTYLISSTRKIDFSEVFEHLKNDSYVEFLSPVISSNGKEMGGYTSKIIIKTKNEMSLEDIENIVDKYGLRVFEYSKFDKTTVFLQSKEKDASKNQEIANALHSSGIFEYADPNYLLFVNPASDPLYSSQWHLNNTGQVGGTTGEDIKAPGAWTVTTGSSSIKIAILDSGVDLDHEDLTDNMGAGYDATGGSSNGDDWYFHGTAVAGVAAARGDNSKGVRGVAYYSTIIPVRFYNSASGWSTTESGYLQSAIQWIRTGNRADIINMSFTITQTTSLNSEINTAASSGRGGKGIVMVASSGNNNSTSIGYPSSNSNVISVGASNQFRQRVSPTSSDGTSDSDFLGSNYGSGLDIVAPGLNIRSTNIAGTIPANFYLYYKGTSYSAPQVSGAAALVLSVNSNLTREQVKNILESTADKIGTYTYSSGAGENPSLTWNSEMGYGRLNACRAVTIAKAGKINGSDLVCSNSTFTLDAIPAGATISWSSSNTGILTINSSTGVATRVGSGSGSVTITSTLNASCGSVQLTKVVWVGNPDLTKRINGTIAGTTPVNPGNLYNLTAESQSPSTSFNYNNYTGSGDMVIDIYYPNSANTQMYVYGTSTNGSRHVRVTATNSCGSYYQDFVFYIPSFFKSVYPNPAKDYLTLDFNDLTEKATLPDAIELYNEASMKKELVLNIDDVLKDTKNQQGNKYILDIKDLKRGVWYLHAVKKGYKTEVIRLLFE